MKASLRSHLLLCNFPLTTVVYQILKHAITKSPKLETQSSSKTRSSDMTSVKIQYYCFQDQFRSGAKSACAMLILG